MKKYFLSFVLLTVMMFTFKIEAYPQKFEVGGKFGLGLSSFSNWDYRSSGSEFNERSSMAGLQVSLIGKYAFSDLFGLQAELQFIQKGENFKMVGSTDSNFKEKTRINYLTLPILFNASHSFGEILVFGNIGPYFGFGLNASSIVKEPIESNNAMKFQKGGLRRFDMGLCIGGGVGYQLGPGNVFLDLRYDLGFINIYSPPDDDKGSNYKATCNRTLGITVGYIIPLGQE